MSFKYIVCLSTVNISNYYGDSSENNDLSFKAVKSLPAKVQKTRNKRKEDKLIHNTKKDAVSQGSSSISDSRSVPKHKRNQQPNGRKTSKYAVDSPKLLRKENEDDGNLINGTLRSISYTVKRGGMQRYEKKNETEEEKEILSTGEKRGNEVTNRYLGESHEKRASLCDEKDKEGENEKRCGKYSTTEEYEAQKETPLRSNTSIKESIFKEVDSVRESEAEEGEVGQQDREDGEKGDEDGKSRASGRRNKKDDSQSEQEGNYNEVLTSDSERNTQDR